MSRIIRCDFCEKEVDAEYPLGWFKVERHGMEIVGHKNEWWFCSLSCLSRLAEMEATTT